MKIEKTFDFTLAHKFPDGSIASIKLGTTLTMESVLDNLEDSTIDSLSTQLAERVYKDTLGDLKRIVKKNKIAKAVFKGVRNAPRRVQAEEEASRILDEHKD
jgi:hypothetical protein